MKYTESKTHLSQTDRFMIERMMMSERSFKEIAAALGIHPTTVSREIRANRTFLINRSGIGNDCTRSRECTDRGVCGIDACTRRCAFCQTKVCREYCEKYVPRYCEKLGAPPYICNRCEARNGCKKNHAYYNAHTAHANSQRRLSASRSGLHASAEELRKLDKLITPLLKQGQSLNHIFANHADEICRSRKTIYNYIEARALSAKNIDLPRKVRYKRRKLNYRAKTTYKYRVGRTIEDYKNYLAEHPELSPVEMDTVKGSREKGNVLLTMIFCESNLMLLFLLPAASQENVISVVSGLTKLLGINLFRKLFPVILTDNGGEFKDVNSLEYTANGADRTKVFYCDPQASWQKPHIEKNHEFIRYVLPQGKPFGNLTQADITLLQNHINSFSRDSLGGKTPFVASEGFLTGKAIEVLALKEIPPDDVILTPELLSR